MQKFDENLAAYYVTITTEYNIRNLLEVPYSDEPAIGVIADPLATDNPPSTLGSISSIKVGGIERIRNPEIITKEGFDSKYKLEIPPNETRKVVFMYDMWLAVGELQALRPPRVVEYFEMEIINRCIPTPRVLTLDDEKTVTLLYNEPFSLGPYRGSVPGDMICAYKLLAPIGPDGGVAREK